MNTKLTIQSGFGTGSRRAFLAIHAVITLCISLGGCASVSVRDVHQHRRGSYPPKKIYLRNFTFIRKEVRVDRSGQELKDFRKAQTEQLTQDLQKNIQKSLVSCKILQPGQPVPQGPYWLVTGNFDRVYQGSRAERAVIGFGVGRTWMDATTYVYALSEDTPQLIYEIKTRGSSGAIPGAIVNPTLIGAAVGGSLNSVTSGLSYDTRRTAREITAVLSHCMYKHGAITKQERLPVKRDGHWP